MNIKLRPRHLLANTLDIFVFVFRLTKVCLPVKNLWVLYGLLCESMTASIKSEVHDLSLPDEDCVTAMDNMGRIFFRKLRDIWISEIFSRTDIQIDIQTRPSQYLAVDEVILHVSCMNHAVKVTISVDQHMNASASLTVN